jgi:hypothetical protein
MIFSLLNETIISFLILGTVIAYTIWYANQAEE